MGTHHLKYLSARNDAKVTALADPKFSGLKKFKGIKTFNNHRDLLKADIDAVCITTPNNLHARHIIDSANAFKHIFCEKPLALTKEDGLKIVKSVKNNNVIFTVNYSLLFQPATRKLLEIYKSGELGALENCWCIHLRGFGFSSHGAAHPAVLNTKTSGGWLIHHAIHPLAWLYETGGRINNVYSKSTSTLQQRNSEESIFSVLGFDKGKVGTLFDSVSGISMTEAGILGKKASAVLDRTGKVVFKKGRSQEIIAIKSKPYDSFHNAWEQFLSAVKGKRKLEVDVNKAYSVLEAAIAMKESIVKNKIIDL